MKNCPICSGELVNVGSLDQFEDTLDNHVCRGCHRTWYQMNEDEWGSRAVPVIVSTLFREGGKYSDIVQVKKTP